MLTVKHRVFSRRGGQRSIVVGMSEAFSALTKVLREQRYLTLLFVFTVAFLGVFIVLPVITIPGNTVSLQLSIFRLRDYILMGLLAALAGLNLTLQVYLLKQPKTKPLSQAAVHGAVGSAAGIFSAVIGTASCASCLFALFALIGLGAGSVLFVLQNQTYFLLGAFALMVSSIYFAAQRINKVCMTC